MGDRNLKFTKGEVGRMIGIVAELDPDEYTQDWARATIYKCKSLYGPIAVQVKTKNYKTWTV